MSRIPQLALLVSRILYVSRRGGKWRCLNPAPLVISTITFEVVRGRVICLSFPEADCHTKATSRNSHSVGGCANSGNDFIYAAGPERKQGKQREIPILSCATMLQCPARRGAPVSSENFLSCTKRPTAP